MIVACGEGEESFDSESSVTRAEETNGAQPIEDEEPSPRDAGSGNSGRTGNIDPCSLLTDEEVEAVLGARVQGTPEEDYPLATCRWEREGSLLVRVEAVSGDEDVIEGLFELGQQRFEKVEGIGDRAHYSDFIKTLYVMIGGNTLVTVEVINSEIDEKQAAIDLAEKAVNRLP
jgi:hypothetical protein